MQYQGFVLTVSGKKLPNKPVSSYWIIQGGDSTSQITSIVDISSIKMKLSFVESEGRETNHLQEAEILNVKYYTTELFSEVG